MSPSSAAAPVSAYAASLAKDTFAHAAAAPHPPTALQSVHVNIEDPSAALQLGVDEVRSVALQLGVDEICAKGGLQK